MSSPHRNIEEPIIEKLENPEGTKVPIEFIKRQSEKGEVVYIRHHIDKRTIHETKAKEEDFKKYSRQYEQFQNNQQQREAGTSIDMLPAITEAEIKNLEMSRVHTIERLAEVPENILQQIGYGARALQQRAKQYLEKNSSSAREIAELKEQIAQLTKEKANEPIDDGSERSGRNATVRKTNNSNRKQQQGNKTGTVIPKQDM